MKRSTLLFSLLGALVATTLATMPRLARADEAALLAAGDTEVSATVSADETRVALGASGSALADAARVSFKVWSDEGGPEKAIEHEAVRNEDGSWSAIAFIASNRHDTGDVPYSCDVPDAVHRLFNPNTGQHLFTADANEAAALTRIGWRYETVAWAQPQADDPAKDAEPEGETPGEELVADAEARAQAPAEDATDDPGDVDPADPTDPEAPSEPDAPATTVYRLYNPTNGEHHYTLDANEYAELPSYGWRQEGEAFTSDAAKGAPVYRVFNPELTVGTHHFTSSENEYRTLVANGWRDEGIAWYGTTVNSDGSWCAASLGHSHEDAGTYTVEVYATPRTEDAASIEPAEPDADAPVEEPAREALGSAAFTITCPTATATVTNVNNARGTYDVVVSDIVSPSGVSSVAVPTWSDPNGQDDLVWYTATPNDNGYTASVDVAHHSFTNEFTSHVYLTAGNGVSANVAKTHASLTLANYLKREGGPYSYRVMIYNPGNVSRVQMAAWSEAGGQDDLVWYDAHDTGYGWWSATIETDRLQHSGCVHVHVYADGAVRGGLEFDVQSWEILAPVYRAMNDRVRGLSSPTSYLLAVDTSNCFVGVYRGSKGAWQNTTYWTCAPGAAATPTVKGVFWVGNRGYEFGHGYSCYYWVQFYGDYLFHSIKYYPGTFTVLDGTLGRPASLGCVRLQIENARWIYENVPSGTTVLVY